MDSGSIVQLVILIILLLLSAFFSSAETALTTVNKIKLKAMEDEGNARAKLVLQVTENSHKMLSAILIGNNIVNLSASSLATRPTTPQLGASVSSLSWFHKARSSIILSKIALFEVRFLFFVANTMPILKNS